jgi:tetratricopeptide (TPR) repeat protein
VAEAEAIYRDLVRKHPREGEPLYQLGVILSSRGRLAAAVPFWRRATEAAPSELQYKRALARGLVEIGQLDGAVEVGRSAVEVAPSSAEAHLQLASLYRRAKQFDAAIEHYEQAIGLAPDAPGAHGDLANLYSELGRTADAIECYTAAVSRDGDFADGWANLGATLHAAGHGREAIEACRQAVIKSPRHPTVWLTLGNALADAGRWAEAVVAYDTVVANNPGAPNLDARYNRSLADLAVGDFARGWSDYRLRHTVAPTNRLPSGLPRWGGESLVGKTLLVRREQGIGTQVMFSGYVGLVARHAGHVIVECDGRVKELLARSYAAVEFRTADELFTESGTGVARLRALDGRMPDVEAAIGDLPSSASDIVPPDAGPVAPRLLPDPERIVKWRRRLAELPGGFCVGVSWRGGGTSGTRRKRSTSLTDWHGVLATPGINFINLQYGPIEDELRSLPAGVALTQWPDFDPTRDLDDLVALSLALQRVITVDNSTAHLAAAAGAATWILLPAAADWRWMSHSTESRWYPAARLVRQVDGATWTESLARVADELLVQRANWASVDQASVNSGRAAA